MSQYAIGIDLGTTFSALAYINAAGHPEMLANVDGDKLTASAVLVNPDGVIEVGKLAWNDRRLYPDRVETEFKRRMDSPQWRGPSADPKYSAVDFSTFVLRKLKQDAEVRLGPVHAAVISVPAYFDQVRRQATMRAAEQAGLAVVQIINEPTAAAVAYLDAGGAAGTVLIFDLGGGTFDVTIANIVDSQTIEVIASAGDHRLGGIDFDRALAADVDRRFQFLNDGVSIASTPGDAFMLEGICREMKHTLSRRPTASAPVGGFSAMQGQIEVSRGQFEELIADYLAAIRLTTESVLDDASMSTSDIDRVLVVGGSTRIPAVRQLVESMFGQPPVETVHPDEAVALGAALVAGIELAKSSPASMPAAAASKLQSQLVTDVTPWAIGTTVVDSASGELINDVLLPKNTPLPARVTRTYFTSAVNQTNVECDVTQAAANDEQNPAMVDTLESALMSLPDGRKRGCPIEAVFTIDINGAANFMFTDVQSGREQVFHLDMGNDSSEQAQSNAAVFEDLIIQ